MVEEVYDFSVTVATGSTAAAPQVTALTLPTREVEEVEILVPPGPRGELGLALGLAGRPILPRNPGAWIVTDDEVIHWPLRGQPTSGAWQLSAWNTGQYAHTVHVRFLCSSLAQPNSQALPAPLPAAALAGL